MLRRNRGEHPAYFDTYSDPYNLNDLLEELKILLIKN